MAYNLKSTAWHARFYEWLYMADVTDFKTMCPYVWKYLLTIVFFPVILPMMLIIKFVISIFEYSDDLKLKRQLNGRGSEPFSDQQRIIIYLGVVFSFLGLYLITKEIINWVSVMEITIAFILTIIGGVTLLLLLTLIGMGFTKLNLFLGKPFNPVFKPFIFLGDMISATYHKYCPLLTWDRING